MPVREQFSASVQTGSGNHPASYIMGTGPFPGVKRPRRGLDHPTLSSAEVKEGVSLYVYSPFGHSWPALWWNLRVLYSDIYEKVKRSRYRPGVAQRVGRDIALLFHDRGTRRGWVVSSTPRPQFTPRKDPIPIVQEVGWAPGPVWTCGKYRLHLDSNPEPPARWLCYI